MALLSQPASESGTKPGCTKSNLPPSNRSRGELKAQTYLEGGAGSAQRSQAAAAAPRWCNPTRQTEDAASFVRERASNWEALCMRCSVDIP